MPRYTLPDRIADRIDLDRPVPRGMLQVAARQLGVEDQITPTTTPEDAISIVLTAADDQGELNRSIPESAATQINPISNASVLSDPGPGPLQDPGPAQGVDAPAPVDPPVGGGGRPEPSP